MTPYYKSYLDEHQWIADQLERQAFSGSLNANYFHEIMVREFEPHRKAPLVGDAAGVIKLVLDLYAHYNAWKATDKILSENPKYELVAPTFRAFEREKDYWER